MAKNRNLGVVLAVTAALLLAGCGDPAGPAAGPTGAAAGLTVPASIAGPPARSLAVAGPLAVEPDEGWRSVEGFISSASKTLDMTMYELEDPSAQQALIADAHRGVTVRVILDHNLEQRANQAAFTELSQGGVNVVWAPPRYAATHQKTITVDGTTSMILTGNLTARYYPSTRDFGVVDRDPVDVAAIEDTFTADATGEAITPPAGDDLVWSPTNARASLLALISSARTSLAIENEEFSDRGIVAALADAARRGVAVTVTMTDNPKYHPEFDQVTQAGAKVATYHGETPLYIHAKVIVADQGRAFLGSENFTTASLGRNRELGVLVTDPGVVSGLGTTLASDAAGATPWTGP